MIVYCIALIIFSDDDGFWKSAGWTMGILTFVCTIILTITEVPWKKNIEYDISRYQELKNEVQAVRRSDCDVLLLLDKDLYSEVRKMNNYIDKNKIYCDSWWIGWFYSSEIGDLPKISYIPLKALYVKTNKFTSEVGIRKYVKE